MSKYKIGDRVRVINGIGALQDAMRGRVGTVTAVREVNGVEHCWVLIDGFDNPHTDDPTIVFHYNQLASWLNDSKDAKELAMVRYLRYKNNGYKNEVARYCCYDIATTKAIFNATRTVQTVIPEIKSVIYSDPATIVFWKDGTKTVVKCSKNDVYDPEKGLAMAFSKKMLGNKSNYYNVFKKWLPEEKPSNAAIPLCHEIQDALSYKRKKFEDKCKDCIYGDDFSRWLFCTSCVNGDKRRSKK